MRGLPFALAHEEMVRACRAPPIDARRRIVLVIVAELPEGFAGAGATAAMGAVGHGVGNAQRLDEQRRHARGQAVGLSFLGWKWLKNSLPRVGQDFKSP